MSCYAAKPSTISRNGLSGGLKMEVESLLINGGALGIVAWVVHYMMTQGKAALDNNTEALQQIKATIREFHLRDKKNV